MRKFLVLLPVVFFLNACDDSSKIKDVVRQNLKDPGSANFKDTIFSSNNQRSCIVWNAKNSMGGYGDWAFAELSKENSEWVVKKMKGLQQNCSEAGFKELDALVTAEATALSQAINILQKAKSISIQEATELGESGKCRELVRTYVYNSAEATRYRIRRDSGMLAIYEEKLKEAQTKLDTGSC